MRHDGQLPPWSLSGRVHGEDGPAATKGFQGGIKAGAELLVLGVLRKLGKTKATILKNLRNVAFLDTPSKRARGKKTVHEIYIYFLEKSKNRLHSVLLGVFYSLDNILDNNCVSYKSVFKKNPVKYQATSNQNPSFTHK